MIFLKKKYLATTTPDNKIQVITDITTNVKFLQNLKNTDICLPYYIKEGDTPESVSYSFYETQIYSWLILKINEISDINSGWPLSATSFSSKLENEYGNTVALFLKLDSISKYDIKKGDKICLSSNTAYSAEVVEWNASLSKLVIKYLSTRKMKINDRISILSDPLVSIAVIGRVVDNNAFSLHHFELERIYVDPLLGNLQGYVLGGNENVVTNFDYETSLNDSKRFIFVPKTNNISSIYNNYLKLISQS